MFIVMTASNDVPEMARKAGAQSESACNAAFKRIQAELGTETFTRTLNTWLGLFGRCYNPTHPSFSRYGGRGIHICERWMSFPAFVADMGARPADRTLDRIDKDGSYYPDNCRWATVVEQARNTGRNRFHVVGSDRLVQAEIARLTGLSESTVSRRLRAGITAEQLVKGDYVIVKLTRAKAQEIRDLGKAGVSRRERAARFGVSRNMVAQIDRGQSWT